MNSRPDTKQTPQETNSSRGAAILLAVILVTWLACSEEAEEVTSAGHSNESAEATGGDTSEDDAVKEIQERFPDYEIDTARLERYATEFVQGYSNMPTRWRP